LEDIRPHNEDKSKLTLECCITKGVQLKSKKGSIKGVLFQCMYLEAVEVKVNNTKVAHTFGEITQLGAIKFAEVH
jgi:hypothetical protein